MQMKCVLHNFALFVITAFLFDASASVQSVDVLKPLKDTMLAFRTAKMVDFRIERTTFSDFTGEKKALATAALSGSLFRLEVQGPPKEIIVYDGKFVWVAQYPDPNFPGPVQVLKSKVTGQQKQQLILSELVSNGKLLDWFEMIKTGEQDGVATYVGTPKEKRTELKKVTLQVQGRELKSLEYVDEIGNRVRYKILKQKLLTNPQPLKFKFNPPKGAQVSES